MLQFITNASSGTDIVRQITEAVDGGCRWIEVNVPTSSDEEILSAVAEAKQLCIDTGAIITFTDNADLAKRADVGGVHITDANTPISKVRLLLGGAAIIGVSVCSEEQLKSLRGLDIDYVRVLLDRVDDIALAEVGKIISAIALEQMELPIVVEGDFEIAEIKRLLEIGVNGIALKVYDKAHDMCGKFSEPGSVREYVKRILSSIA